VPERATILQGVQLGVETTPGTAVAATKHLLDTTLEMGVQLDMQRYRPIGQKYASSLVVGKEWSQASVSGALAYNDLVYLLNSLFTTGVITQQGATTAYSHVFSPAARVIDNPKTYTLEFGGAVRASKFSYGLMTDFGITVNRSEASISGTFIGQAINDGITLTPAVPDLEEKPVIPNNIDVFMDPTFGALGTTKLTRLLAFGLSIGSRYSPVWVVNSAQQAFVSHVEVEPTAQFTFMVEADTQGMTPLTALRNGTSQFVRLKATSADLAGVGFPYSVQFDLAGKVSAISNFQDQDGVYALEYTWDVVYDPSWTNAILATVINKMVTL
jgi:hypothetical protein